MGAIDTAIKSEIVRLSKREARKLSVPLRSAIKSLKKRDAELKARISSLEGQLQGMRAKERLSETASKAASGEVKGRLSPRLIRALRKRLGLPRQGFAKLVGASSGSVFLWESGKITPRPEMKAKIMSFRGMGRR